jgi:RNA polymerase sigma-70 factor (ECF subfamily)
VTAPGREQQARELADAVARASHGKLVAFLAARDRDVVAAEDALAEAYTAALADWPRSGCPDNPEAWLLTVARRKQIDVARRRRFDASDGDPRDIDAESSSTTIAANEDIPDQRLALMFACAHPAIDASIRAPLMLQVVLGLDAARIASAFLVAPATMGKRLVRAKDKIRQAGIPFRVPDRADLPGRLDGVLDAIYAAFAVGWVDPAGTDAARRDLADEALFLGRLVAALLPGEPEAIGLLALMLHAEARRDARRAANGDYVPIARQDPRRWNMQMIEQAEALLRHASTLGRIGRYQLEAALQSAHLDARRSGRADTAGIVRLYDALLEIAPSPVIAINRAVALAARDGAHSGLAALDAVAADPRLREYQPYWAARADLLVRAGMHDQACRAYEIAIGLESDPAVRRFLQSRMARAAAERRA